MGLEVCMRAIETTVTVDEDGVARLDQSLVAAPGRHRVVVVIDDAIEPRDAEPWTDFIELTYGSFADSDLMRYPQDDFEQREDFA